MPFAYSPHVRTAILERLAAGERLRDVCAEAGAPSADSVRGWMRREPGFAGEVAAARRRGDGLRRGICDEGRAGAILAGLAAGAKIAEVLRGPGMPSYRTYVHWRRTDMWFAEEVGRLMQVRAGQKAARMAGRYRAFDPVVAERLYVRLWKGGASLRAVLASDPAFPSLGVLARWRREEPQFDAMLRFVFGGWRTRRGRPGRGRWSPDLEAAVLDGIVGGGSLRSLGAEPDMPCAATLYAWCRTRPDFAARVAQACEDREDGYRDQILEIAMGVRPGGVGAARKAMAPLNAQLVRLKKRPGWKARRGAP